MHDERELVAGTLRGDAGAFRTLVQQYQRLVAHIVYRMMRNQAECEDVCQEVFVRVYQKLNTFRQESKLSTWIARIAYRTCLNQLEKQRAFDDVVADTTSPAAELTAPSLSAVDELAAGELRAFVRERVQQLPLPYRTALTLYYLEQMSVQEVCAVMALPSGTVKSHLYRGRALLREQLLQRYAAEELNP